MDNEKTPNYIEAIKDEAKRIKHGRVKVEFIVQDGYIQYVRITETERNIKIKVI